MKKWIKLSIVIILGLICILRIIMINQNNNVIVEHNIQLNQKIKTADLDFVIRKANTSLTSDNINLTLEMYINQKKALPYNFHQPSFNFFESMYFAIPYFTSTQVVQIYDQHGNKLRSEQLSNQGSQHVIIQSNIAKSQIKKYSTSKQFIFIVPNQGHKLEKYILSLNE
nr:hypothetical protein [Enterococcus cecorum]